MNRKTLKLLALSTVLIFLFVACTPVEDDGQDQAANESIIASLEEELEDLQTRNEELNQEIENLKIADDDADDDDDDSDPFLIMALEVMEDIKLKDFDDIADYVDEDGLLFSPYGYIDTENAIVFSQDKVENLDDDNEEYEWGSYDGSGEAIILNFDDYYDEFIYDQDFLNADIIGNNVRIGEGNTLENIHEVFEEAKFVEFYFQGFDDEYEGMDWVSLRLVFIQDGDSWNLVAIVHDQWTI